MMLATIMGLIINYEWFKYNVVGVNCPWAGEALFSELQTQRKEEIQKLGKVRRCRGSNPGHPRDRRENDLVDFVSLNYKYNRK